MLKRIASAPELHPQPPTDPQHNLFGNASQVAGSGLIRGGWGAYGGIILGSIPQYAQSNVSCPTRQTNKFLVNWRPYPPIHLNQVGLIFSTHHSVAVQPAPPHCWPVEGGLERIRIGRPVLPSLRTTEQCLKSLKKALLVGVNYIGTNHKLRGCINDVMRMKDCLVEVLGFSEKDITILIDTDHSYTQPTRENIRQALSLLVGSAKPGDILFLYFSGHGSRKRSKNKDDDTGYDESIVAVDDELMIDDYFKELVDKVPQGCILTILSDSCHSGGLIEGAKEQIGDSTKKIWLNSRGISELDNFHPVGYSYVGAKWLKEVACLEREEIVKGSPPDCGILLSACQSNEKAWEASCPQNPDDVYGVFTNAILDIIKELHGQVTNRELVEKATEKLMEQGWNQTPGLYCSDDHANAYFLSGVRNN